MTQEPASELLVVCLCAIWCNTCTEFRGTMGRLGQSLPGAEFAWLDIDDDSALVGEVEIENFPTLAVFRGDVPVFYGVTMPQEGVVLRMLTALDRPDGDGIDVPDEIAALPVALRARRTQGEGG